MRFNHIIWDFDGTLFDTYPVMARCFQGMLAKHGIEEQEDCISALMKVSIGETYRHFIGKYLLGDGFKKQYEDLRTKNEFESVLPFNGIPEVLRTICESCGYNYLFTHRGNSALRLLEKYDLLSYFKEAVTKEQNFARKPSPDAIHYLMNKYGFPAEEAIMVGDREIDILSGKNAGIFSCCFTGGGEKCGAADFNIDSFSDFDKVLRG